MSVTDMMDLALGLDSGEQEDWFSNLEIDQDLSACTMS